MSKEVIQHYGVKGMHWGQRKAERAAAPRHPRYSSSAQAVDLKKFKQRGVDRINQNMHKGMDLTKARKAETTRRQRRNAMILGAYFVGRAAVVFGPQALQSAADNYVGSKQAKAGKQAAANLFSDSRGIGSTKIVDLGFDKASGVWA